MSIFLAIASFSLLLLGVEIAYRRKIITNELARKTGHILAGLLAILFSYTISATAFISIALAFALGVYIAHKTEKLSAFISDTRKTYGVITFPLGLAVLAALLYQHQDLFIAGVLIMTLADSAACLVGNKSNGKTFRGSATFFTVSLMILLFAQIDWQYSVILAGILTLVEKYSSKGSDNLTVPLVYSLIIILL